MPLGLIFEADTAFVFIEWVLPDGEGALDLTGATVETFAAPHRNLSSRITFTSEIISVGGGIVKATAPRFAFTEGVYLFEQYLTVGSKSQTYQDDFTVGRSLKKPD